MYYDEAFPADKKEQGTVRDMNVFSDGDKAYIIYTSNWNSVIYIGLLDETFTAPACGTVPFTYINDRYETVTTKIADMSNARKGEDYTAIRIDNKSREAPALTKAFGRYYMITSDCNAWTPSTTLCYSRNDLFGTWSNDGDAFKDDKDNNSFHSQSTCIVCTGRQWMYMGDRWDNSDGEYLNTQDSRYVWLPLDFTDEKKKQIEWKDSWIPQTDCCEYAAAPIVYSNTKNAEIKLSADAYREYILYEPQNTKGVTLCAGDKQIDAADCKITGTTDTAGKRNITLEYADGNTLYRGSYSVTVFAVNTVEIVRQPDKLFYSQNNDRLLTNGMEVRAELDGAPREKRFIKPYSDKANFVTLREEQYSLPDRCETIAGRRRNILRCGYKYDFLYYVVEGTIFFNNAPDCYGRDEMPDTTGISAKTYSAEDATENNVCGEKTVPVSVSGFDRLDMNVTGPHSLTCTAGNGRMAYNFMVYETAISFFDITEGCDIRMYHDDGNAYDNDGDGIYKVSYYDANSQRTKYEISTWGNYRTNELEGHIVFWSNNGAVNYSKILYDLNGYQYNEEVPTYNGGNAKMPLYDGNGNPNVFTFRYKCGDGREITASGYLEDVCTIRDANERVKDGVQPFFNAAENGEELTLFISKRYEKGGVTYARGYFLHRTDTQIKTYCFDYSYTPSTNISAFTVPKGINAGIVFDPGHELHDDLQITVDGTTFYADAAQWHHSVIGWQNV